MGKRQWAMGTVTMQLEAEITKEGIMGQKGLCGTGHTIWRRNSLGKKIL